MKWPRGPYAVKQGIRGYRFTVVDREGSAIADVPEVLLVEHDAKAVANLLCAAPEMYELAERISHGECTCADGGDGFECEVCEAKRLTRKSRGEK